MKYVLSLIVLLTIQSSFAQILLDDFNDGNLDNWIESATDLSIENNSLRVDCENLGGKNKYQLFFLNFSPLDMSKHTTLSLKINVPDSVGKAPNLRIELRDINGYDGNLSPVLITPTRNAGFVEYKLDFKNRFKSVYPIRIDLDPTSIVRLGIYINANDFNDIAYTGTFYFDDLVLEGAQDKLIIPFGATFQYAADTTVGWNTLAYDASAWMSGSLPASYNNAGVVSTVDSNLLANELFIRKEFYVSDTSAFKSLLLRLKSDDEATVKINNVVVAEHPFSAIQEQIYQLPLSLLDSGQNVITVHQSQNNDVAENLWIDFQLEGSRYNSQLVRGPYQQLNRENAIRLRWRTLTLSDSKVKYGVAMNNLTDSVVVDTLVADHSVDITNLQPFTKYYYTINSSETELTAPDSNHYFITHPEIGTKGNYEFWVIGDAGRSTNDQRGMMDAYLSYKGNKATNSWLLLGDNAYDHGTEDEYQRAMFENMFEEMLVNTTIYPTPGNHDLDKHGSHNSGIIDAPYFDIFDMPTNGEAGGVASGLESYYSWDYGNVHFISLDSYGTSVSTTGDMYKWLENDLKANAQRWTVAYCHHPPFSKGTHDSEDDTDSYGVLKAMRENFMPLLENHGVDLVLTGHSHVYERSYLSHGFYEKSDKLPLQNAILYPQSGGGVEAPYRKNVMHSNLPNKGTVYAVVGCSGSYSDKADWDSQKGNFLTKDFFHVSTKDHTGSFVLNVKGDTLSGLFLNNKGAVLDDFRIMKDAVSDMRYVYGVGAVVTDNALSFNWVDSLQQDSVLITWETSFLAETKFDYGLHPDTMMTIYNPVLTKNHSVKIPLITEGYIYYAVAYNEHKYMLEKSASRHFTKSVIGITSDIESVSLRVYPNPITEQLTVQLNLKQSTFMSVDLVNLRGDVQAVLLPETKFTAGNIEQQFKLKAPKGMYLLRVNVGGESVSEQVIIE